MTALDAKYEYEYLVKYKNLSYLHIQWLSGAEIGTFPRGPCVRKIDHYSIVAVIMQRGAFSDLFPLCLCLLATPLQRR